MADSRLRGGQKVFWELFFTITVLTIDDANTEENKEGLHDFPFEIPYEAAVGPGIEMTVLNHDSYCILPDLP